MRAAGNASVEREQQLRGFAQPPVQEQPEPLPVLTRRLAELPAAVAAPTARRAVTHGTTQSRPQQQQQQAQARVAQNVSPQQQAQHQGARAEAARDLGVIVSLEENYREDDSQRQRVMFVLRNGAGSITVGKDGADIILPCTPESEDYLSRVHGKFWTTRGGDGFTVWYQDGSTNGTTIGKVKYSRTDDPVQVEEGDTMVRFFGIYTLWIFYAHANT